MRPFFFVCIFLILAACSIEQKGDMDYFNLTPTKDYSISFEGFTYNEINGTITLSQLKVSGGGLPEPADIICSVSFDNNIGDGDDMILGSLNYTAGNTDPVEFSAASGTLNAIDQMFSNDFKLWVGLNIHRRTDEPEFRNNVAVSGWNPRLQKKWLYVYLNSFSSTNAELDLQINNNSSVKIERALLGSTNFSMIADYTNGTINDTGISRYSNYVYRFSPAGSTNHNNDIYLTNRLCDFAAALSQTPLDFRSAGPHNPWTLIETNTGLFAIRNGPRFNVDTVLTVSGSGNYMEFDYSYHWNDNGLLLCGGNPVPHSLSRSKWAIINSATNGNVNPEFRYTAFSDSPEDYCTIGRLTITNLSWSDYFNNHLDTSGLTWQYSGGGFWYRDESFKTTGQDSLSPYPWTDGSSCYFSTEFTGSAISFDCMISNSNPDFNNVFGYDLDEQFIYHNLTNTCGWTNITVSVTPDTHKITFYYLRPYFENSEQNRAWIDNIKVIP